MLTNKNKRFLKYHIPLHIVVTIAMWVLVTEHKIKSIVLCLYWTLAFSAYLYKLLKREAQQAAQIRRLEELIHDIIELEYVHERNHAIFHAKLLELLKVESLLQRGIIRTDRISRAIIFNRELEEMDPKDTEFLALLEAGFSTRGIKVVYGLKDLNSVYMKTYRLKERLSQRRQKLLEVQKEGSTPWL